MAYLLFWSWIFIVSLIRPACGLPSYEVLAKRALEQAFVPEFSQDQQSRNTFMAVAITCVVIFVAVIAAIILTVMRHRKKNVEQPEAGLVGSVDKPTWFMVETEKVHWWRNFQWQSSSTEDPNLPEGSRVERIKAALSRKKEKSILPLYNDSKSLPSLPASIIPPPSNTQLQFPDILDRAYKAPLHQPPQQSAAQVPVPSVTRKLYGKSQPRSPPKAVVTQGFSRSVVRNSRGLPRSPAARRKSWLARAPVHHPFLPVKDDASSVIAPTRTADARVPQTRFISRPSPLQPITESRSKHAPSVPIKPALRPPPLDLDEEPRRRIRFGGPKVRIAPFAKIRIMSPAF